MKFQILYTTIAAGAVAALDMSNYAPKPGVPAEFKPFYEA